MIENEVLPKVKEAALAAQEVRKEVVQMTTQDNF
jgi:hypothetical protein